MSLRSYNYPVTVHVTDDMYEKGEEFADNVIGTIDYSDSNQFSMDKIKNDHFVSKLGEECVRKVFSEYFDDIEGPDYEIYEGGDKSWDEDLKINGIGVGVKTQKRSTANKFGLSWTFQSGPHRKDRVLEDDEAWICFAEYDDVVGRKCIVFPPYQIKELDFKDPVLDKLKGKKRVIYGADISSYVRVLEKYEAITN